MNTKDTHFLRRRLILIQFVIVIWTRVLINNFTVIVFRIRFAHNFENKRLNIVEVETPTSGKVFDCKSDPCETSQTPSICLISSSCQDL